MDSLATFRLDNILLDRLRAQAKEEGRTTSELIRIILREYLEDQEEARNG